MSKRHFEEYRALGAEILGTQETAAQRKARKEQENKEALVGLAAHAATLVVVGAVTGGITLIGKLFSRRKNKES